MNYFPLRKWSNTHTHTLSYYSSNSENGYQSINQHLYFTSASQTTGNLYRTHNRKLWWHTESDWSYDALAKAYYALSILNTAALLSLTSPRNVNINTYALNKGSEIKMQMNRWIGALFQNVH